MGFVNGLTQVSVLGVGDDRDIARHIQPKTPGSFGCARFGTASGLITGILGGGSKDFQGSLRNTVQLSTLLDHQAPGLGGIEHVVAESGGESGHPFTRTVEIRLLLASEGHSTMLHREKLSIEDACLGAVEGGSRR